MHKKILAVCAALMAFAVVPATASAFPHLTTNAGVAAVAGDSITATNSGNIVFTSGLGSVTCSTSTLGGKVSANTGKLIEGNIESASFTGHGEACSSWAGAVTVTPENLPWCIASSTTGKFTIRGGACSKAQTNLAFTLHFPGATCKYERSASVSGSFKENENDVLLTLEGEPEFTRVTGGFPCPTSGKLHGAYRLTNWKIT